MRKTDVDGKFADIKIANRKKHPMSKTMTTHQLQMGLKGLKYPRDQSGSSGNGDNSQDLSSTLKNRTKISRQKNNQDLKDVKTTP